MTDKQIIINGCNVSECKHFEDEECLNPSETVANCEASPNCDYKQLKLAEQRIVELNKTIKAKGQECERLTSKCSQLKQTLSEIKEIAEANKKYIYVLPSYFAAGDSLEFSFEFTKNILQKISECEVIDE